MRITFNFRGAENIVNGQAILRRSIAQGAEDSAALVLNRVKHYPNKRGDSYKRTGTLKRSWHMEVFTTTAQPMARVSSNGNIAPYNRYVQDQTRQARIHRGRWHNTAQQVATDSVDEVAEFYRTRIRQNFNI